MSKSTTSIVFTNIIRFGQADEKIESNMPEQFRALIAPNNGDDYEEQIRHITSKSENKLIELIIIPDHYFTDVEVLQTVQVRDYAHKRKNGIGIVMTATAAECFTSEIIPDELWCKIYKLSTIRHGFQTEKEDENAALLIHLSTICIEKKASSFREIVIRACEGAGSLRWGLAYPDTLQPIGVLSGSELDDATAEQARLFLHGTIGSYGSPEYKILKQLSLRNQTMCIQHVALTDANSSNVAFSMRAALDQTPSLRHLSVKAYYDTVNPVPEHNPTRMGQWDRRRSSCLCFPKAVRLISPDNEEIGEKRNHLIRPAIA